MTREELTYVEALEHDRTVLLKALYVAGQYARENLPAALPSGPDASDYLSIIAGGQHRDPEGKEFAAFWARKAKLAMHN